MSGELRGKKKNRCPNCIIKVPKRKRTRGSVAAIGHPCMCKTRRPPTQIFFLFTDAFEFPMAGKLAYKFALLLPSLFLAFQVIKHHLDFPSHRCRECRMDPSACQKRPKWCLCHTRANLTQELEPVRQARTIPEAF